MTISAMNKVLDTPEVLEMILGRLDMRTLLVSAQRVCRNWMNLIRASPSLQMVLFFTSINGSEWGKEKIPNPLLAWAFPSIFPGDDNFSFANLIMTKDDSSMARFIRKDASWRKMLVQQPPISEVGLFHIQHTMGGDYDASSNISPNLPSDIYRIQADGSGYIRMERLFEILLLSKLVSVHFTKFSRARVYWSTEEPISFMESVDDTNREFHRMLNKFSLVVYTHDVTQCSGGWGPPSQNEGIMKKIIAAYKEHCLDVDMKSNEIGESSVGGELVRRNQDRNDQRRLLEMISHAQMAQFNWR
ncbi:hypothetical protein N7495_003584 [Penicillium taxi]|uniref:uncharacterized protein n=1 Tax=Penicillium taxi TaxID=168475 RepID=UPI002544EB0C|nr:uncharacterized protein N7495_003584 [Penicillium taxi]KAJ5898840.1 hypothetical protein N7495_003584 [Penicillium taxi]